jgi:hypothetical protein
MPTTARSLLSPDPFIFVPRSVGRLRLLPFSFQNRHGKRLGWRAVGMLNPMPGLQEILSASGPDRVSSSTAILLFHYLRIMEF